MAIITLTTDFGTADHYVAAMKGVILSATPKTTIVDVTHDIPPAGVIQAAFVLAQLPATFPPDTVHVAVVDPTVGTGRAILAAQANSQFFIAPDNGLLTFVQQQWGLEAVHAVEVRPAGASDTFHGRDIIAPAAAVLASRGRLAELGPPIGQMEMLDVPAPEESADGIDGQVIHIDRFGNCTTNIPRTLLRRMMAYGSGAKVHALGRTVGPLARTYADVPPGTPLALIGSAGLLELAVNLGSAAQALGLAIGSPVAVRYD